MRALANNPDLWMVLFLLFGVTTADLSGQQSFQVNSELVLLSVSVQDARGFPVSGLTSEAFRIREEGVKLPISYFQEENSPFSVVLLLDVSSSMRGAPLNQARQAALKFIAAAHPETEMGLVVFNHQVRVIRDLSSNHSSIKQGLSQLSASGGTALFDALIVSLERLRRSRWRQQAIVLLSDGKDQDSKTSFAEIEGLFQSGPAVVFAVGEYSESEREFFLERQKYYKLPELEVNLNPAWVLKHLSTLSGGRVFFPEVQDPPEQFFEKIALELRDRYLIGFVPAATNTDRFVKVEVEVKGASADSYQVHTRTGYRR